jgi:nucleoside-diphosphate-sugar epimerase
MRVLVTGATGFIGAHLTRLLIRRENSVYVLVRETSNTRRIYEIASSVRVIRGDLLEPDALEQQLIQARPELCFHLAWYAVPGKYLASTENLRMLSASINFASLLAKVGCKRFVSTGTCLEYDTDAGYLSEDSPTKPRSLYAASKLSLYHILTQITANTAMSFAWARLFYQYGSYEDERRLVPSIICSLLRNREARVTSGEQIRDFLHVEDVAAALMALGKSRLSGPVNIGSSSPISVRDMAKKIGEMLGRSGMVRIGASAIGPSEPIFVCANNSLLKRNTGWNPRYDLEEGLRQTIAWWRQQI